MAYLYRHIRLDTNEVFYIGIGVGHRAWQKFHRNIHWRRIVSKTGYIVEVMIDDLTWEQAIEKEKEFIAIYGRRDKKMGTLVNLTDGGEGMLGYITPDEVKRKISSKKKGINPRPIGWKMTEEGRRKMSLANKGKQKSLGRVLSENTRAKISDALKGHSPTNAKPILMFTVKGGLVAEYESANEAGRANRCLPSSITAACRYRINAIGKFMGFVWRYKSECMNDDGVVLNKISVPSLPLKLKRKPFSFPTHKQELDYYLNIPHLYIPEHIKTRQ